MMSRDAFACDVLTATATHLRSLLDSGQLSSVQVVQNYLTQISKHNKNNLKLNAVIFTAPAELLIKQAQQLDEERSRGQVRGPLHGIPILVKDTFMTSVDLGMPTSAGAVAFRESHASGNCQVVDTLLRNGLIILGKASMTEFCGLKAKNMTAGWSAVNGFTQSPYIRGGIRSDDLFMGRSTPGGSSTGSAVGVAAGFAPIALGTETAGSVCMPANRAGLYSIKWSYDTPSLDTRTLRLSYDFDCLGAMARCTSDLRLLDGIFRDNYKSADAVFKQLSVGFVDPEVWNALAFQTEGKDEVAKQIIEDYKSAMKSVEELGIRVAYPITLPATKDLYHDGQSALHIASFQQFKSLMHDFCSNLTDAPVRTLEELVAFNKAHTEQMMPAPHTDQTDLIKALNDNTSSETVQEAVSRARRLAGLDGIDQAMSQHNIDMIIGPGDCSICVLAALAGYPSAMVPLSRLRGKYGMGQPQGLMIISTKGNESKILSFMELWEGIVGPWKIPPLLSDYDS